MRLYQTKQGWKIGKNGEPVYKSRKEAKEAYISNKLQLIRSEIRKVNLKRNGK
jgi:hypothetical protein